MASRTDDPGVIPSLRPARDLRGRWTFAASIALAALAFSLASLDLGYTSGMGSYWRAPAGDVAQGQIAWFYYARDAWRWPIYLSVLTFPPPEVPRASFSAASMPFSRIASDCSGSGTTRAS